MTTLKLNTSPVPKRNSITEMRTDGECFSFTFTCGDVVFHSTCRLFGNEAAQKRVMKKIIDAWPKAEHIKIERSADTMQRGIELNRRIRVERKAKK